MFVRRWPIRCQILYFSSMLRKLLSAEILPRILLENGRADLGAKGLRGGTDLVVLVESLLSAFGHLYIWDYDGIRWNRPNLNLLRRFEGRHLWVDAGVRNGESVIDVLVAGADVAVVGTKTLWDFDELEKAADLTENIVFQVDYRKGILTNGPALQGISISELVGKARHVGISRFSFLDDKDGLRSEGLQAWPSGVPKVIGMAKRSDLNSQTEGLFLVDAEEVI